MGAKLKPLPGTEKGDNWTVVVFVCQSSKYEELVVQLSDDMEKTPEARLLNFMIRACIVPNQVIVSFRVLRDPKDEVTIKDHLRLFLDTRKTKKHVQTYSIDPKGSDPLKPYHAWIHHGDAQPYWSRDRCEALNEQCQFVTRLSHRGLFSAENRIHMAHLVVAFLGLQEARAINSSDAYYRDMISGALGGPYVTSVFPLNIFIRPALPTP